MTLPAAQEAMREPAQGGQQQQRGGQRGGGGGRKRDGIPYLSNDDLSTSKKKAKILDVKLMPDNFNAGQQNVVAKIAVEGQQRLWTLRATNPCYKEMVEAWGTEENDWADKPFFIFLDVDDFTQKRWPRVEVETVKTKSKK